MGNPFKNFHKKDWALWLLSLVLVVASNVLSGSVDPLTLAAVIIGVTSLIFAAKGNVWSQVLMIVFSILYGIISFRFRYWGEMITYLGMTFPMAVWSMIIWLKNPADGGNEVAIQKLTKKHTAWLVVFTAVVTAAFYFVLAKLNTPNIVFSTISVATSFVAAALTMLRSPYYAVGYAANDVVLVVLWVLASLKNPEYIPVVANFAIFFVNDMYGFVSWKKREKSNLEVIV